MASTPIQQSYKSKRSSSSSSQPFLLCTTTLSSSLVSATAPNNSFNCSSVTLLLNCPLLASIINLSSTSLALLSFTSLMRPRRSAAEGSRICARIEVRASASCCLGKISTYQQDKRGDASNSYCLSSPPWPDPPPPRPPPELGPCCFNCARRAFLICVARSVICPKSSIKVTYLF